jgi:hypothetical protein
MSGMVAGQIPIAATATSVTSSIPTSTFLTGNQTVTLSGDITGAGATAITTTLASVNSNVGTFQGLTVNAKGLVTAAANQGYATVTAMNAADALLAPIASPTFTGDPKAPTPAIADNDTSIATTAYVQAQGYATTTAVNLRVLKAGDAMTGALTITQATGGAKLVVSGNPASGSAICQIGGGPAGSDTTTVQIMFLDAAFGAVNGSIGRNGTNTVAYATTSDERLKADISDSQRGLAALMALRVSDYRMGETLQQGLLAQQVAGYYPEAVLEGGDDPAMQPWMIDYGRLTPLLVRAVQQLAARVEALEARLKS